MISNLRNKQDLWNIIKHRFPGSMDYAIPAPWANKMREMGAGEFAKHVVWYYPKRGEEPASHPCEGPLDLYAEVLMEYMQRKLSVDIALTFRYVNSLISKQDVIAWLTENKIEYTGWNDLECYTYYLTHNEDFIPY